MQTFLEHLLNERKIEKRNTIRVGDTVVVKDWSNAGLESRHEDEVGEIKSYSIDTDIATLELKNWRNCECKN
jgi:hypothetical protein